MSMMAYPDTLDSRTVVDIYERNGGSGCDRRGGRWSICDYHEGYDAALEEHDPPEEPA